MAAPRYIDRDDVDSNTMLSAALYSYHVDRLVWDQLKLYGNLTMVEHSNSMVFEGAAHDAEIVKCIPCMRGIHCNRCRNAIGGYEFRWFSPLWSLIYVKNACKGSWLPGKSETRWRKPVTYPSIRMIGLNGLPASSDSDSDDHEDCNHSNSSNSDGPPPMVWSDSDTAKTSRISASSSNESNANDDSDTAVSNAREEFL